MRRIFRYLRGLRFPYEPLVEVTISESRLLHNFKVIQSKVPKLCIAPVLKANAYGHGIFEIASILEKQKGKGPFIVDSYYEAITLRNEGIQSPILIIGHTLPSNIYGHIPKDVSFTIHTIEELRDFSENLKSKRTFHLKVDTGMHRQGILISEIAAAIQLIQKNKNIEIEGICSHLGDAENENSHLTVKQIQAWNQAASTFRTAFPNTVWFHLGASAGISHSIQIDANMIRVGIALYGIKTANEEECDLKPILQLHSVISGIKEVSEGEEVGYGGTFTTTKKTKLATVPVGYYEGVDLRLSNKGYMRIGDAYAQIVGRVSMNISILDVSEIPEIKIGSKVIVISENKNDKNSVENTAKLCGTIPYEILVHIPFGIRRTIIF